MSDTINYEEKWKGLNSVSEKEKCGKSILIDKTTLFKVYIYSHYKNMKRSVIIELPPKFEFKKKLPQILGVECFEKALYGGKSGLLFVVEQKYGVHTGISELFMSELSRVVLTCSNQTYFEDELLNTFEEWKGYFLEEVDSFGPQKQLGLYGEMYFLNENLFKELGVKAGIKAWKGYEKNRHDFELNDISFEIKATTSNNPVKVKISNEKQLEKGKLKHLYLTVYNMVSSESKVGDLPKLLVKIIKKLSSDPTMCNAFKRNIMSLGYRFENENQYNRSYSILNIGNEHYEIDDTFPVIRLKELKKIHKINAFMDVKYSINMDTCKKYQCKGKPKYK